MEKSSSGCFGKDIKGVILDIDGVLLDSLEIWKDLGRRYLKSRGKEAGIELDKALETMSMEESAAYLARTYLQDMGQEEILRGLEDLLRDYYFYKTEAMPGAGRFLQALKEKGLRITAATLSPGALVGRALQRNGLDLYIEKIFTAGDTGMGKTSSGLYDAAAAFMGLSEDEICIFEDAPFAAATAAGAGYHTVRICIGDGAGIGDPDEKAGMCIKGLEEAIPLIWPEGGI